MLTEAGSLEEVLEEVAAEKTHERKIPYGWIDGYILTFNHENSVGSFYPKCARKGDSAYD